MELPRGFLDRLLYAFVSLFMLLFLAPFVVLAYHWDPQGLLWILVKLVVEDVLLLFFSMFVLAFIWCLFTPAWVARMVASATPKVVYVSVVLVVGLVVALVANEYVTHF